MKIKAKKHLGQNFLKDVSVLKKIVEISDIKKSDYIIEVGPGLGILTKELAKNAKKVTTIELDSSLIPILKETLKDYKNIEIIHQDVLEFSPPNPKYKIIANIPYYITSPIINRFLQAKNKPSSMTLLVQKEIAEKITDKKKKSILSLQVELFGEAKLIKKVPPSAFSPSPKVDSAILHIEIHKNNYISDTEAKKILSLAKIAFSQKRKKLKNTLGSKLKNTKLDLNRRPETLSLEEWLEISKTTT